MTTNASTPEHPLVPLPTVFAPVAFRTAHGEPATEVSITAWDAVDFEVYEHLVTPPPPPIEDYRANQGVPTPTPVRERGGQS